jgi:kynureninase
MKKDYKKALRFDQIDPLVAYKNQFVSDESLIYLDGNSLGKLPKKTLAYQQDLIQNQWGNRLIRGWNDGWVDLSKKIAQKIALLVGAQPEEIFVGDTTSLHLYKLVFAALTYQKNRNVIVTDDLNFPSDLYVLQGMLSSHFKTYSLEIVKSSNGIDIKPSVFENILNEQTALLTLSHVTYKGSYMYPMEIMNTLAHKHNSMVLWDLSHSVGAVPIALNASGADMAIGCTYKYLNGGPGAPAFLYVKKELQKSLINPIWAWFSHERPFAFENTYIPSSTIEKFATSTPSILSLAAIEPGVTMLLDAGIDSLRKKSVAQSDFLIYLVEKYLLPLGFSIASPLKSEERGSHISIKHKEAYRINRAMITPNDGQKSIIPDFRPPNNIRLGIAPLYTSFIDLYDTVQRIRAIVLNKEYEYFNETPLKVP